MKQEHRQTIERSVRICADVCTVASRQTHVSGRDARHRHLYSRRAASGPAGRSVWLGPCGKGAQCIRIVVDDVDMRVLLPAARERSLEQIARAARIVDGIEREIERLACLV